MGKIAVFETDVWQSPELIDDMKKKLEPQNTVVLFKDVLKEGDLDKIRDIETLIVFIKSKVTKEVISKLPKLKFVATMSTGFDHIDLAACRERNIMVSNVPSYGENSVAEHAFALIVTIARKLSEAVARVKNGKFETKGLCGFDLKDKTIGVIGTGHIGLFSIKIAQGYSMKVIAYDAFPRKDAKELGFEYASLDDLYQQSDIITIHVPLLPSTKHMINQGSVEKMKKGVVLINTSRGGVVDNDALLYGLENRIIGAAGLDVLDNEECLMEGNKCDPKISEKLKRLVAMKNVYITPHNAFNTKEAIGRIIETTLQNVKGFAENKLVNIAKPAGAK